MGRRTVLLVVALLVAAVGTSLVFVYVNGVNERALADQKPVKVLVATTTIAAGTSAADAAKAGAFQLQEVGAASAAPGALSDISPISSKVALAPIFPGEQILAAKFGALGSTSGLTIPSGELAVSVQLTDPARVAGFVQPGSNVAVFASLTPTAQAGQSGPGGQSPAAQRQVTRVLLPKAQVIAVGPTTTTPTTSTDNTTGQTNTEQLPKAILTLALGQVDAQKLIYASQQGQLYFGLLGADSKVDRTSVTDATTLFK